MNRIHRTVWNPRRGAYMVAAETTRSQGKASGAGGALLAGVLMGVAGAGLPAHAAGPAATALPSGGQVTAGQAQIGTAGNTLTVTQGSAKAAINWGSFSIGKDASVQFVQPNANAVALNRVTGTEGSVIDGVLKANGQVFILNPNGVLFGKGARVDTAGLVATTLGLSDADFLAGKTSFAGHGGAVANHGSLTASDGGYIALIGQQVKNDGVITARLGTVALAAGDKVSLNFNGNALVGVVVDAGALDALVANGGAVRADGGLVLLTARGAEGLVNTLVNNTGEVRAQTVENREGRIYLLGEGGKVEVAGTLDASAAGAGHGGFIETSGSTLVVKDGATVHTQARQGANGTWLIDPTDFTISAGTGTQTTSGIGATTLQTALGAGNVTIQTQSTGTDVGDINVNAPVAWSANRLTLEAYGDININAVMTASGTSTLNMKTGYNFNVGSPSYDATKLVRVGMDANGAFTGRVDFNRTGTGILTINGTNYILINSVGTYGSTTTTDLQGMQGDTSRSYALASNIDASATVNWDNYLTYWTDGFAPVNLTGKFDGLGHVVSNLYVNAQDNGAGLFGNAPTVIRNVGLAAANITGPDNVGALVGNLGGGTVSNSWSSGTVNGVQNGINTSATGSNVGGLVGNAGAGTISRSWSSSAVTGGVNGGVVGGLVGLLSGGFAWTPGGSVEFSHATGAVVGFNDDTGGLVGKVEYAGWVRDSYATGSVTGNVHTGGLIGQIFDSGPIQRVYATGTIVGEHETGGLIGYAETSGIINDSYATGNVSAGNTSTGGLIGEYFGVSYAPGVLEDLHATGAVTGTQAVGGLIGLAVQPGLMSRLSATGNVSASLFNPGGLIGGLLAASVALQDSYALGNVTGPLGGGLIGGIGQASTLIITHTYSTGTASSGGLIGQIDSLNGTVVTVTSSFWNAQTSGISSSADGTAIASNTAAMTTTATFTGAGWNFATGSGVWIRRDGVNNNYPFLRTPGYVDTTALTLTLGSSLSMTYGDATPSLSGLSIAGCNACVSLSWGSAVSSTTHVGTYSYASTSNMFSFTWANGFSASDYTLTLPTGALTVTPRPVSLAAVVGATRVYDGSTLAAASLFSLGNLVNGDSVSLGGSATLSSKSVGTRTASLGNLALTNADYTLAGATPGGTVAVTAAPLTVTATGGTQVYDGSMVAQVTLASNKVSGDQLTLSDSSATLNNKNVGTAKAVAVSGIAVAGTDAGNYTLQNTAASTTTNVTAAPLTVTATGGTQVYNGDVVAQVTLGSNKVAGDQLTLSDSSATLNNKNVGTAKAVAVSGIAVAGTDAGNYTLQNTAASTTTNVTAAPLTVTATGGTQVYNGDVVAQVTLGSNKVAGDQLTLSDSSATLNNKNVGTAKAVAVSGISVAGTDAGNYILQNTIASALATVTAAPLTVTATGGTQVYDGSVVAQVTLASNKVAGDQLTLSDSSATLNNKNVGTAKAVAVSGIAVAGTDAGNYTLQNTAASTTTNVTAAPLTVTATGGTQVYDGSVVAHVTLGSNKVAGDQLTLSDSSATLGNKNVGAATVVTVGGIAVAGADAGNYTLQNTTAATTTNVTAATLVATATGGTQVYDGSTHAVVTLGVTPIGSDAVTVTDTAATLNDKNVGPVKAVTVTGLALSGADAGNYVLQSTSASTTTHVTAAPLTVTATGGNQVYDGSLLAQVTLASNKVSGDQLTLSDGSATLGNKNVGTAKAVAVSGISIAGADAGNYNLQNTTASTATNVTAAPLTVTATGGTQVYDGSVFAQVTLGSNKVAGDQLTLGSGSATLDNKNAGTGKAVTVNGIAISGSDAGNYSLQNTSVAAATNVAPAPVTLNVHAGASKVYDGTTLAASDLLTLAGLLTGDSATLGGNATLASPNVGTRTVGVAGLTLDNGNYALTGVTPSGTVTVTARPVSVTVVNGATKVYDGTTSATTGLLQIGNVVSGDTVNLSGTATLAGKDVGARAVTFSGVSLDNGNYTLTGVTPSGNVTITARPVSVAALNGATKVYDGTTSAAPGLLQITNLVGGDVVNLAGTATLAGKGVGNHAVSLSGLSLDNGNYTLAGATPSGTVTVTPRTLNLSFSVADKAFDGSTTASVTSSDNRLAGDQLGVSFTAAYNNADPGTAKPVSITGLGLSGEDAGNYAVASGASTSVTGNLRQRSVSYSLAPQSGATTTYTATGQTLLAPSALDGLLAASWANTVAGTAPGALSYTLWKGGLPVDAVREVGNYEVHASFVSTDPHYLIADAGNTVLTLTVAAPAPTQTAAPAPATTTTAGAPSTMSETVAQAVRTDVPTRSNVLSSSVAGVNAPVALAQYNPAPPNVMTALPGLNATFGEGAALSLLSSPNASESSQSVTLNQAKLMMQTPGGEASAQNNDVRVPVSRNSLASIVNGGVKLPGGVDQLLFVVKADK